MHLSILCILDDINKAFGIFIASNKLLVFMSITIRQSIVFKTIESGLRSFTPPYIAMASFNINSKIRLNSGHEIPRLGYGMFQHLPIHALQATGSSMYDLASRPHSSPEAATPTLTLTRSNGADGILQECIRRESRGPMVWIVSHCMKARCGCRRCL